MSAAVPAWKLALLERKKQQEEAERAKQVKAEEQKLASLPAWKRAIVLREKQTKEGASTPTAAPIINKSTPKWQVAVERVKGSDSPILPQKLSWKSAGAPPLSSKSSASVAPPPPDDPPSTKHEPELSKPTTSKKVASRWQHAPGSTNKATQHSKPAATSSSQSPASSSQAATEDDSSLAGLPAWKKALILKKRKAQQQLVEENTKSKGVDEPDSAANTTTDPPAQANDPVPIQQPEIVNRSNKDGEGSSSSQRLVEQEGITLHPPVYKEIDEWANVNEQDDKFQGLPLWKQALIKRRRADIAKRSGQPVPTPTKDSTKPNTPVNSWSTKESKESTTSTKKANVKANKKSSIESKRKTKQPISSKVRSEVTKPARKAPVAPATKKEPMFTYNFSKSSSSSPHHTLNAGGSSSDSTDSDLEDAVVTNLDDSDEDDSGIVLQSYAVNKTASRPSPIMGQKSLSATTVTEKTTSSSTPRKKHMRRVSWSDTQLVSEYFYPKYDYSDYEDIEREEANKNQFMAALAKENSGLSHRLHPSLLQRKNDTDSYGYGSYNSTSPPARTTPSENSFSSFVPKALSGHSPQLFSGYADPIPEVRSTEKAEENGLLEELDSVPEQTDDFYADLATNTAALLW